MCNAGEKRLQLPGTELRGTSREFGLEEINFVGADDRLWRLFWVFAGLGAKTAARNT